jgi:hypothetical protein
MPDRLTPTMRTALAALTRDKFLHRPHELPGGQSTVRALVKRGLAERNGQWVRLTPAGREQADR